MAQQDLSPQAQSAITTLQELPPTEQATVVRTISLGLVRTISLGLAQRIWRAVKTATPTQLARASAHVVERGEAALAHGFREVTAPDDTKAIEVKITRPNGEEVTCLLSEGARGTSHRDLAGYGKKELNGASLLPHADFEAVVDSLCNAIQGMKVLDGALDTDDAVLKQAYQIVKKRVRRDAGVSHVCFVLDDGGAVAGRRIFGSDDFWNILAGRHSCALFGASPAE